MKSIQRIAIIGNAGSGKSTLAQELHKITHLPVYHLDQYFWGPNWAHPNIDEYKKVHDALCDKEQWIIDGMNLKLLDYRAQRAEVIIFLDFPRYVCFWRIFKRMFQYYGKSAPTSAQGCPERFSWDFIKFLKWVWDFKNKQLKRAKILLDKYASEKRIYVFTSQKEVDIFLNNFGKE